MCHCAVILTCYCILSDKISVVVSKDTKSCDIPHLSLVQVWLATHWKHPCVECEPHVIYWLLQPGQTSYATYNEFRLKKINIISALFRFLHLIIIAIIICPLLLLLLFIITISTILLIILTSPIMLTIRYLQLWNPLHQCQSGLPHRWVQRCPLQEVRGTDRLSRGGRCAWGGATEHHSMTYDPKASQLTSTPVAVYIL